MFIGCFGHLHFSQTLNPRCISCDCSGNSSFCTVVILYPLDTAFSQPVLIEPSVLISALREYLLCLPSLSSGVATAGLPQNPQCSQWQLALSSFELFLLFLLVLILALTLVIGACSLLSGAGHRWPVSQLASQPTDNQSVERIGLALLAHTLPLNHMIICPSSNLVLSWQWVSKWESIFPFDQCLDCCCCCFCCISCSKALSL